MDEIVNILLTFDLGVAERPTATLRQMDIIESVRASVIGTEHAVPGPFGSRRVTYADYTASGRSLSFIEDYIRDVVLPLYANTHTEVLWNRSPKLHASERIRGRSSASASTPPMSTRFCSSAADARVQSTA